MTKFGVSIAPRVFIVSLIFTQAARPVARRAQNAAVRSVRAAALATDLSKMNIAENVSGLIGSTPMVYLNRVGGDS